MSLVYQYISILVETLCFWFFQSLLFLSDAGRVFGSALSICYQWFLQPRNQTMHLGGTSNSAPDFGIALSPRLHVHSLLFHRPLWWPNTASFKTRLICKQSKMEREQLAISRAAGDQKLLSVFPSSDWRIYYRQDDLSLRSAVEQLIAPPLARYRVRKI